MKPTVEQVAAGQGVYTKRTLSVYNVLVRGISNRCIWRCPSGQIRRHYNHWVTDNHLDVGVSTEYFLDRCCFPSKSPRVALMVLNPNTLECASQRISRYSPETYRQNISRPVAADIQTFDSVGINYLLRCLPGSITEKAAAFDHLRQFMNSGATIFSSTILHRGVRKNRAAVHLMKVYSGKRIFPNSADSLKEPEQSLHDRFDDVAVRVAGCVALFSGRLQ